MEAGLKVPQLLVLGCGLLLGQEVTFAPPSMWRYSFSSGKYKARAHLSLTTQAFFERKPKLFTELIEQERRPADILRVMLPQGVWESNEVEFQVLRP
jgi:hypothetical protein